MIGRQLIPATAAVLAMSAAVASAQAVFTFESSSTFESTPPVAVTGDTQYFVRSTAQSQGTGANSLRFDYTTPPGFTSFTYDLPIALTEGTISVWFYDAVGAAGAVFPPAGTPEWGGSIILEDANNPADFGAVEISNLGYGGPAYYGTEGTVDRLAINDRFDSSGSLGVRSVGWHQVTFTVGATSSTISVNGGTSTEVGAPGGDKTLRLRFMIGSASNGGFGPQEKNWFLAGTPSGSWNVRTTPWVFYDDLSFTATAPAAASASIGFETGQVDSPAVFMASPKVDVPEMRGFVPAWGVNTNASFVRTGTQSIYFDNNILPFRNIAFDLSNATPGIATIWFYDTEGPTLPANQLLAKVGGSIIMESGLNPNNFLAVEVNTWEYPVSGDPTPGAPNYYLTNGTAGGFNSRYFGNRQVGWNRVDIHLEATRSRFVVNGVENSNGAGIVYGPGLDTNPTLRIMADSASSGGFSNWRTIDELDTLYMQTNDPYVYYDNISLPVAPTNAQDWTMYE